MYCALAIAFASVAAALPAPQVGTTEPLRFTGLATGTGNALNTAISASNGQFWLGKNTTTYAPEGIEGLDPAAFNSEQTIFSYLNAADTLALSTSVPGGQQIYVAKGDESIGQAPGQLRFTPAHSAMTQGPADYNGFVLAYDAKIQYKGADWLACRAVTEAEGVYNVFAVGSFTESGSAAPDCMPFVWKVQQVGSETVSAWQYQ